SAYLTPPNNYIRDNLFIFSDINRQTVFDSLKSMKMNSATGLDGVSYKMINFGKLILVPKLINLFNCIIKNGIIPNSWKKAKIIWIYKNKGDKNNPSNYRPISLLSCVSKLFEKCILTQINPLLDEIIPKFQHGFRKNHSILTALTEITDYIYNSIDNKKFAFIIQFDIKKAYDSVNHHLLTNILNTKFNLDTNSCNLFVNFFTGRKCCSFVNNSFSNESNLLIGLPQGSVLAPILFSIFISDITNLNLKGKPILYADDLQILYNFSSNETNLIENHINNDFIKINTFFNNLELSLNNTKTVISYYCSKQLASKNLIPNSLILDGKTIIIENDIKNLGLILDTNLSFEKHFVSISNKCFLTLFYIKSLRKNISIKLTETIIKTLIIPHIRLLSPITMTAPLKTKKIFESILNFCIRIIHNINKNDHISHLKTLHRWANFDNVARIDFSKLITKMIRKESSNYLNDILVNTTHNRTRHSFFRTNPINNCSGAKTIKYRAPFHLNSHIH
ncbi:MAG: RNA-directed DNA polymerase, partial [Fusobacteriaceae bacterium]